MTTKDQIAIAELITEMQDFKIQEPESVHDLIETILNLDDKKSIKSYITNIPRSEMFYADDIIKLKIKEMNDTYSNNEEITSDIRRQYDKLIYAMNISGKIKEIDFKNSYFKNKRDRTPLPKEMLQNIDKD
jgi:hypothetical protein